VNDRHPAPSGGEVAVIAHGVVAEDRRTDLVPRLSVLRSIVAEEPGTLAWQWYYDRTDASVLWVYELYADEDALDRHRRNVAELLPGVAECFLVRPEPHRCRPLAVPSSPEQGGPA
jgi:quinol monooxygenase YgiN